MDIAVIGIHRPVRRNPVCSLQLHPDIIQMSRIDIPRTPVNPCRHYYIVRIDIEHIHTIIQSPVKQGLGKGQFVVPHSFRLQVSILGRKHIHFPECRISEPFGCRKFELNGIRQMERKPCLRDPLRTDTGMMVHPHSCVESQPAPEILAEIYIACYLMLHYIRY